MASKSGAANGCSERIHQHHGWGLRDCSRAGVVERNSKWWCKQHDPDAVQARGDKWQTERDKVKATDAATEKEARRILSALGVKGNIDFLWNSKPSGPRLGRSIVISFEEAEKVIAKIGGGDV